MLYPFLQKLLRPLFKLLFPYRIEDFRGFPDGPKILVANHKSNLDPILISIAFHEQIFWMGKRELFDHAFLRKFFTALGAFPVDREGNDLKTLKHAMKLLKEDKILGVFPEGTRVTSYQPENAKSGTALIASRTKAHIIPIYIEGDYKLFRTMTIHMRPIYMLPQEKRGEEDYARDTKRIMETIYFGGEQ